MSVSPSAMSEASASNSRKQDSAIQALRGVAVILLVSLHVIGSPTHGLRVSESSLWYASSLALQDVRMPLFTLISGYVYAMAPIASWPDYPRLIKGKSRRLLLPLITVGTLFYVVGRAVPGDNFDERDLAVWRIYVFSFEHLWFLQAIFVIFVIVGILDSLGALRVRRYWGVAVCVAGVGSVVVSVPAVADVFSVGGAIRLLPYFLLGYGLRRHRLFDLRGVLAFEAAVLFSVLYAVRLFTIFGEFRLAVPIEHALALAVGASGIVLLYSARHVIDRRILAWIGGFSYCIYLLHVFATAGTRIVLEHIGVHRIWELFLGGLVMGIAVPIAFQLAFRNVSVVRTLVLGERGLSVARSVRRRTAVRAPTSQSPNAV